MNKTHYGAIFSFLLVIFIFLSFDINNEKKSLESLNTLTITDTELPNLPEAPFNYEDVDFPEHVLFSDWGTTDTTVLDFVTDEGAALGRVLFFDKKLSAIENISCASCHAQEFSFADNVAFSEGVSVPTKRNSLQLNDIGWTNRIGFFWDMSQTDLQEMIQLPLKDENEIGAEMPEVIAKLNETSYYPELFTKAYGDAEVTEERITDALSQFISSMVTFNSRRDLALQGDAQFTHEEEEGMHIFEQTCGICHFDGVSMEFIGIDIFAFPFLFSNGLEPDPDDKGMGEWMGSEFDGLFKIPTLRNIEKTGPYMHDGRFETLEEVVDFYSDDVQQTNWTFIPPPGFQFSDEQKSQLVAFLKTFTDDSFLENPKWSDPFKDANTSSEDPFDLGGGITVSPNPFQVTTSIKFDNNNNELIKILLVDSSGKAILTDETSGSDYQLDKDNLSPGTYFLNIIRSNRSKTVKVIAL